MSMFDIWDGELDDLSPGEVRELLRERRLEEEADELASEREDRDRAERGSETPERRA